MRRIALAVRVFFQVLFGAVRIEDAERLTAARPKTDVPAPTGTQPAPEAPARSGGRSEALSLLAALQREARFVDFVKEPIAAYSDAQIGAAARDVHRDCGAVLERMFAIRPLVEADEGNQVEVPAGFDAVRYKLAGNVAGQPPYRGALCHHGWQATRAEVPEWTGGKASELVLAPAEVELK